MDRCFAWLRDVPRSWIKRESDIRDCSKFEEGPDGIEDSAQFNWCSSKKRGEQLTCQAMLQWMVCRIVILHDTRNGMTPPSIEGSLVQRHNSCSKIWRNYSSTWWHGRLAVPFATDGWQPISERNEDEDESSSHTRPKKTRLSVVDTDEFSELGGIRFLNYSQGSLFGIVATFSNLLTTSMHKISASGWWCFWRFSASSLCFLDQRRMGGYVMFKHQPCFITISHDMGKILPYSPGTSFESS